MQEWIDIERLVHSIKTAIACILGILLSHFIGFPADTWVVITIIVVMCAQIYVGSVILKGALRFFGALLGSIFALMTLFIAGDNFVSIVITMAFAGFFFSYLATSNDTLIYPGTFGAVTTAVILLGPLHTVNFAMQRFLEISTGIIIATLVSQFVLPIHARNHLQRNQAKILRLLRDYYTLCISKNRTDGQSSDLEELDADIIKLLSKQRQLAKEAVREPLGVSYDKRVFMQSLQCEREIFRAIDFIQHAKKNIQRLRAFITDPDSLTHFNNAVLNSFSTLIDAIESGNGKNEAIHLVAFAELKNDIEKNRPISHSEVWFYIDGFLFAAELMIKNLKKLAKLNHIAIFEPEKSVQPLPKS